MTEPTPILMPIKTITIYRVLAYIDGYPLKQTIKELKFYSMEEYENFLKNGTTIRLS